MLESETSQLSQELAGPYENVHKRSMDQIYERIYVLFLRVNATMIFSMAIGISTGVMCVTFQNFYLINAGEKKPFVYGLAFILGCNFLSLISAIISCAITRTHGKALLTVFVGHLLALGLLASGLIVINKFLNNLDDEYLIDQKNPVMGEFFGTINDSNYRSNWLKIHENYNCCGIKSIEESIKTANETVKGFKIIKIHFKIIKSSETNIILGPTYSSIIITVDIMDENLTKADISETLRGILSSDGIYLDLCQDVERITYRGCGWMILWILESNAKILKLCCYLLLPMLIIADILCVIGYFCFNEIHVDLPLSNLKRNKD